ncbi:uncharacterized membrane protein YoaK (UPF0700 family) [Erwinia toletana]|uniref:Uncharacterized membrane protein YoaK (UPF0700 family) n=1 Tax=Winslowiella toletana TaxID=92490 RepID=A0ABS4PEG2_9GAMM|nr:YoaK family protein [Winslowiella toletana]MBP2171029.1 uncharacterized membrane protein YoaK (UPF0700 family) [Winslowiella toletana]
MLIRVDEARTIITDSRLACTLAFVAGALNTAAFEAVGFFSANMTGNVSSLSDNLAHARLQGGWFFFEIVGLFILGSLFSAMVINAGRRRNIRSIYALNILIEACLLTTLGIIECWLHPDSAGVLLILSLSFLMGLQNAVVTRISNARVRTTHVSGTSTDIGIELAMLIDILLRKESPKDAPAWLQKLALHSSTVLAFLTGGVAGIWLYRMMGYAFLILFGLTLLLIALSAILKTRNLLVNPQ